MKLSSKVALAVAFTTLAGCSEAPTQTKAVAQPQETVETFDVVCNDDNGKETFKGTVNYAGSPVRTYQIPNKKPLHDVKDKDKSGVHSQIGGTCVATRKPA